ncbi:MAG: FAD-dependent oxidoreductase [Flavobacteriaceae bacterium]|nr:MAG: FAD-dependent oxidoreductase [Flavobacteriaceae bacterium]
MEKFQIESPKHIKAKKNKMDRRDFLKSSAALAVTATTLQSCKDYAREDYDPTDKPKWKNWSELHKANPKVIAAPKDEAELVKLMKEAKTVRFAGTSHSFMPLIPNDDTIISLDNFKGVLSVDKEKVQARVGAGTKLFFLSSELDKHGQALASIPDINTQSFAGAMSTGTHGTGKKWQAMHAYVKAIKIVAPTGVVYECSETQNPDIFQAAKVSVGTLGAITEVTLQNRPAYNVHKTVKVQELDWVWKNAQNSFETAEHFEIYYIPHTNLVALLTSEIHEGEVQDRPNSEDENALKDLKMLRDYFSWSPWLRKKLASTMGKPDDVIEDFKDKSFKSLAQPRVTKFNESEYHIPKENAFACFKEVVELIDSMPGTYYPVELRNIKQDDAWLSPFYMKDCYSIAVHADNTEEYQYLLDDFGKIFRKHGGRPHWGKLNDFTKEDFAAAYPKWNDFLAVRQKLDPEGKLLNEYTRKIFG